MGGVDFFWVFLGYS